MGTSKIFCIVFFQNKDHPHACGDKRSYAYCQHLHLGSSPRVWGQALYSPSAMSKPRIIPTRVGTSRRSSFSDRIQRDHPHACGDKECIFSRCSGYEGSSPRVWGQGRFSISNWYIERIIPTRVGTRFFEVIYVFLFKDHPHACGDKLTKLAKYR